MINFPAALTEEEEFLKQKYAKLRKKKKALQAMRIAKPENQTAATPPVKRPAESSADALEHAKRLLKSGAIKLNNENKEKQSFKRSKNFEKKLKDPDKTQSTVGFQPFSATHPDSQEKEDEKETTKPRWKGLSESFVMEGSMRESKYDHDREERSENPRKGKTVHVSGHKVTEELFRKAFESIGPIINITMELEKSCGFVTFEKMEYAKQAIDMVNGCMVSDVQLKVTMARRQPSFNQPQEPSLSQKGMGANSGSYAGAKDRNLVSYEDLF
ncbi:negative elongation factor E-like isoform X1 [Argonauta hians]